MFLTHRLSAVRLGFAELLAAFPNNDRIIGNEPDRFAQHLLKIGGVLYYFKEKQYAFVIDTIQRKIKTNADKQYISTVLSKLNDSVNTITIEEMINAFDKERIIRKDDRFDEYIEKYKDVYEKLKTLPSAQIISYFTYYNNFSPYSTQHGIKGAEFDNVLVVMDNGRWNNYNFKYYFEKTPNKESVFQRTERIFYVCCSRAKNNLVVYYPSPTAVAIEEAKALFGDANVQKL